MMHSMASASLASLAFTSQPISAGLTRWQGQVFAAMLGFLFTAIGLLFFTPSFSAPVASILKPVASSRSFRFSALELRDFTKQPNISSPGIKSFGLALDGVPLERKLVKNMTAFSDGPDPYMLNRHIFVNFPSRMDFNGWFIITSEEDPAKDAVTYELRCLFEEGDELQGVDRDLVKDGWWMVGSSGWYFAGGATIKAPKVLHRNEDLPLCRECREIYDYSVRPMGALVEVGTWIGSGLLSLMGGFAGVIRRQNTGRVLIGCSFGAIAFQNAVTFSHELHIKEMTSAAGTIFMTVTFLVVFLVFCFCEHYILPALAFFGVWLMVSSAVAVLAFGRDVGLGLGYLLLNFAGFVFSAGLVSVLYYSRWKLKKKALLLTMADLETYGKIWGDFLQSDDGASVVKLESLCDSMVGRTDGYRGERYARQLNRCRMYADDAVSTGIAKNGYAAHPDVAASLRDGSAAAPDGQASPMRRLHTGMFSASMPDLLCLNQSERFHLDSSFTGRDMRNFSNDSSPTGSTRSLNLPLSRQVTHGGDVLMRQTLHRILKRKSRNSIVPLTNTVVYRGSVSNVSSFDNPLLTLLGSAQPLPRGEVLPMEWLANYKPSNILGPEYLKYTTVVGTVDEKNPVRSLDQLFLQASGVSPLLRQYILKWSAGSSALLPFLRPMPDGNFIATTFERYEEATPSFSSDSTLKSAGGVKWAKLKDPERALEKAMRCYKGDFSRLLDICRQQIVFHTMEDLVAFLAAIAEDNDVRVVRVKNRMSRSFDEMLSSGYRDVMINLRFVNESSMRYGLETHVCEVQLLLLEFAKIKTEEGHKRYVEYRNFRGE